METQLHLGCKYCSQDVCGLIHMLACMSLAADL